MRNISHWFIPHPTTHEKAKLLSWHFLLIYFLLFALLRVGFDLVNLYRPGVLGISSQISIEKVIEETNKERQKAGLPPLVENSTLNQAAKAKAVNMIAENYWAHYSPTGKDPWGFIKGAGYSFSYAGENLARNFYNSGDIVTAWMNSPSHRENILNSHYQEIGIAVVEGTLQGQQTTLVVQMFGRPSQGMASAPVPTIGIPGGETRVIQADSVAGSALQSPAVSIKPLLDPFAATKAAGIFIISVIAFLIAADFIILKKRGVFRISSHHVAHLGFLAVAGTSIVLSKVGEIL